jgi:dihydroflavonol-4-reductase
MAPRFKLPYAVALAAGHAENLICSITGREPQIPLEGVRMSRHKMFVDSSRAVRELGLRQSNVDAALARAARWYMDNGYVAPRRRHEATRLSGAPTICL